MMSYAGIPVTSLIFGVAGVAGFFLFVAILKSIIKVQLPNKLIVVTGRKSRVGGKSYGFSVTSGRTSVVPYLQAAETLDLEILPINVRVEGVNSANGINVGADATACVCIDNDDEGMVYSAVERLMGKNSDQIKDQIQQTLIGNLRGALNKATPLKAIGMEDEVLEADTASAIEESDRAQFRAELVEDINSDLSAFGMKVVSVSFQRIWDDSNYFANLAKKTLSEKRREVEIQEAQLRAEAERAESNATKLAEVAKSEADRKIVAAREALEVYRKESAALIERTRLEAEGRISAAENTGQTEVAEVKNELQKLLNESEITLQESARQQAAKILADGEHEAVTIKKEAKNRILSQKAELIGEMEGGAKAVLFISQQLPNLYKAYQEYAGKIGVDNYVVLDEHDGFNKAVNRGPKAFADFIREFEGITGIRVADYLNAGGSN